MRLAQTASGLLPPFGLAFLSFDTVSAHFTSLRIYPGHSPFMKFELTSSCRIPEVTLELSAPCASASSREDLLTFHAQAS